MSRVRAMVWANSFSLSLCRSVDFMSVASCPGDLEMRPAGLEPATPGLGNRCSILLSYGRVPIHSTCPRSVRQHRAHVLAGELGAPVQLRQLDEHRDAVHVASELAHQIDGGPRRPA